MAAVNPSAIITCIEQVNRSTLPDKAKLVAALYAVLQGAQGQGGAAVASSAPIFKTSDDAKLISQAISYFKTHDEPNAEAIAAMLQKLLVLDNMAAVSSGKLGDPKTKKDMLDAMQHQLDTIDSKLKDKVKKSIPEFNAAREAILRGKGSEIKKALQIHALNLLEEKQLKKYVNEQTDFDTARDLVRKSHDSPDMIKKQLESLDRLEEAANEESRPDVVKKNIEVLQNAVPEILRKHPDPEEFGAIIGKMIDNAVSG